jgi:hypothetical protein
MSSFVLMNPDEMDWDISGAGAPGCYSKKLFVCGSAGLGREH